MVTHNSKTDLPLISFFLLFFQGCIPKVFYHIMVDYIPTKYMDPDNIVVSNNTDLDDSAPISIIPEGPRDKNYWAVILGLVCFIVVIGNVLVIVSVFKEKVLQNITNYFIVSLAVADLLVAGCVMPFSVYVVVRSYFFYYNFIKN